MGTLADLPLAPDGQRAEFPGRRAAVYTVDYGGRQLQYGTATHVMGILNVTPDSFSDGGQYLRVDAALKQARRMVTAGAAVIDVGAESANVAASRPDLAEELGRLLPIIEELTALPVLISVDTYKAPVAEAVLSAGAHIINDISGLRADPDMAGVVAQHGAGLVLMHSLGVPPTLHRDPQYDDVVAEVGQRLAAAVDQALAAGIDRRRLLVDPGIGVGKRTQHNLALLRTLHKLRRFGCPVLLGASRTSVIGNVLNKPIGERDTGTLATTALAAAQGVDMVRVHDVAANVEVARMADAIVRGLATPAAGWPFDEVTGRRQTTL